MSEEKFAGNEEKPKKKRYYNPREVMKEKGCVGCGSMVLGVLGLIPVVLIMIVKL